jgi:hypothetical protein
MKKIQEKKKKIRDAQEKLKEKRKQKGIAVEDGPSILEDQHDEDLLF